MMVKTQVAIIGAGLSGLYAAWLLQRAGIDYVVLEARSRAGGRVLPAANSCTDLGATWLWPGIQPALSGEARSSVGPMVEIHDVSEPDGMYALFGFIGLPYNARRAMGDTVLLEQCRAQLTRLYGPEAAYPHAEFIKDWAADPFTATTYDLSLQAGHSVPPALVDDGPWRHAVTGIASEWSTAFPGYLAGAIDAAAEGVQRILNER